MINRMLVQQLWDANEKQLLAGTGQRHIELAVYKVPIVFDKVAKLV